MTAVLDRRRIAIEAVVADTDEEVALRYGCSREYVRQCRCRYWSAEAVKRARQERRRARAQLPPRQGPMVPCRVCGDNFWETGSRWRTCSPGCNDIWTVLRCQTVEGKRRQRLAVARSDIKLANPARAEHSRRYLNGESRHVGEWLTANSIVHQYARAVYEAGWPIFFELTGAIQEQIRQEAPYE